MATLREIIPLQRAKVVKKSIGGIVGITIFCGFVGSFVYMIPLGEQGEPWLLSLFLPILRIAFPAIYMLWALWMPFYEYLYFRRYFYDMDDKTVTIRKGVFAKKEIVLPFSKITDVYIDQDLFDAMFGLYDVHISTPTQESGAFAHIDGVDRVGSQKLRAMILEHIHAAA